ncbi:HD domain-containing protein [Paenibacillus sp. TRM 82003]|nr:HD domain-containing protein [Paenibacillus sp. TRM 82003]
MLISVPFATKKALLYRDLMEFVDRDECRFFMKRLSCERPSVYQHSIRVALYSMSIGERLGVEPPERARWLRSVLLHDFGMLDMPFPPGSPSYALAPADWKLLRTHPRLGAERLKDAIDAGWVDPEIVLYHHENLDGTGYPFGVQEDKLSLFVRIVRVADSYDTMVCGRGPLSSSGAEAMEELYRWSDICYDASAVEALHTIVTEHRGERA